jgi:membrane-bound ClpP family serine protease
VLYAIILLVLGIMLVVMEVVIPSGGALGVLATAAIVGALILAFMHSTVAGFIFVAIVAVCLPIIIYYGFKIFPKTSFGRKIILIPDHESPAVRGAAGVSETDYATLVGKTGRTITALRPAGLAEIDGERYSVTAAGEMIDAAANIVVTRVEGNNIVVESPSA